MKYKFLFALLILSSTLHSQVSVKFIFSNLPDSLVFFRGVVFDEKDSYHKDSFDCKKSVHIYKSKKPILGGMYFLFFPKTKERVYFILENRDSISISVKGSDYLNMIGSNSPKNESLFKYQRLEKSLSNADTIYKNQMATGKKVTFQERTAIFKEKNEQLTQFRNAELKKLKPQDALFVYYKSLNLLDNNEPDKKKKEIRNTFLNSFDLNSPKLLFTNIYKDILIDYLSYYPRISDSLCKGADSILSRINCKSKALPIAFDLMVKLVSNRNVQNSIKGYNYLIEKYIQNGHCDFLDSTKKKNYLKQYLSINKQPVNHLSTNMVLKDTVGQEQNLHEFCKKFDYTLITFYSPTCEHCQKAVPEMDSMVNLLQKRFKISIGNFAICNDLGATNKEWKDFIIKYHLLNNYAHVIMPPVTTYRDDYDAFSNPLFYLLDKNGQILDKKISATTFRSFIIRERILPKVK